MTADPPLRRDGRCAQCRGPRRYAKPSRYAGLQAVDDPFCSATCCRAWHGVGLPVTAQQRRMNRELAEQAA